MLFINNLGMSDDGFVVKLAILDDVVVLVSDLVTRTERISDSGGFELEERIDILDVKAANFALRLIGYCLLFIYYDPFFFRSGTINIVNI
jgi:GTP:adenosylcobinamide-phosphate guanylyltransferase